MRIWHPSLLPKLCPKHFVAVWREALGAYSIIVNNKPGYRHHPAVKEYMNRPDKLWNVLQKIKKESIRRGYNFKELPPPPDLKLCYGTKGRWQTIEEQIEVLKSKGCNCKV